MGRRKGKKKSGGGGGGGGKPRPATPALPRATPGTPVVESRDPLPKAEATQRFEEALASLRDASDPPISLDLPRCRVGDRRLRSLLAPLASSSSLTLIDLSCNAIGDDGVRELAECLSGTAIDGSSGSSGSSSGSSSSSGGGGKSGCGASLTRLLLGGNPEISDAGRAAVESSLRPLGVEVVWDVSVEGELGTGAGGDVSGGGDGGDASAAAAAADAAAAAAHAEAGRPSRTGSGGSGAVGATRGGEEPATGGEASPPTSSRKHALPPLAKMSAAGGYSGVGPGSILSAAPVPHGRHAEVIARVDRLVSIWESGGPDSDDDTASAESAGTDAPQVVHLETPLTVRLLDEIEESVTEDADERRRLATDAIRTGKNSSSSNGDGDGDGGNHNGTGENAALDDLYATALPGPIAAVLSLAPFLASRAGGDAAQAVSRRESYACARALRIMAEMRSKSADERLLHSGAPASLVAMLFAQRGGVDEGADSLGGHAESHRRHNAGVLHGVPVSNANIVHYECCTALEAMLSSRVEGLPLAVVTASVTLADGGGTVGLPDALARVCEGEAGLSPGKRSPVAGPFLQLAGAMDAAAGAVGAKGAVGKNARLVAEALAKCGDWSAFREESLGAMQAEQASAWAAGPPPLRAVQEEPSGGDLMGLLGGLGGMGGMDGEKFLRLIQSLQLQQR